MTQGAGPSTKQIKKPIMLIQNQLFTCLRTDLYTDLEDIETLIQRCECWNSAKSVWEILGLNIR
jgi:hypothetical protein